MAVEVGSPAPDFTLNDYNKQPVTLSSFKGDKPVLLVFFPFAFSGTCTGELCQLRDEFADYDTKGVQVLGVSVLDRVGQRLPQSHENPVSRLFAQVPSLQQLAAEVLGHLDILETARKRHPDRTGLAGRAWLTHGFFFDRG